MGFGFSMVCLILHLWWAYGVWVFNGFFDPTPMVGSWGLGFPWFYFRAYTYVEFMGPGFFMVCSFYTYAYLANDL